MDIGFKEKTYEKAFAGELSRLTRISFSPDQVDENILGFDDAFLLSPADVLMIAPYVRRRRHHRLRGTKIINLNQLSDDMADDMPPMKFNLFLQYKRPVRLLTRGGREWDHWKSEYYRFDVTPHQQAILENMEAASHGRAAVVYATPAFHESADLWKHMAADAIVDHSNIASAGKLKGHGCYTYVAPGHHGIGHSEPEDIESPSLREFLRRGIEGNEVIPAAKHIIKAATLAREAIAGDRKAETIFRAAQAVSADMEPPSPVVEALETLLILSDAFSISTCMVA